MSKYLKIELLFYLAPARKEVLRAPRGGISESQVNHAGFGDFALRAANEQLASGFAFEARSCAALHGSAACFRERDGVPR